MISRIEINFAIPVEPTDSDYRDIGRIMSRLCDVHCPEGMRYWPSGMGHKPIWSKTDCLIFGMEPESRSPESGEPSFDDEVYCVETTAREAYPEEIERDKQKVLAKMARKQRWQYKLGRALINTAVKVAHWLGA